MAEGEDNDSMGVGYIILMIVGVVVVLGVLGVVLMRRQTRRKSFSGQGSPEELPDYSEMQTAS